MTDNTVTNSTDEFDWFSNNGIFMPMINDRGRNIAYKNAIERVAPGSIICDVGTGTGLLSVLAAKAGAKKVYSIEMDPGRANYARNMIEKLGLSDTVQVINKNFLFCDRNDIPDDIDYFISETIGSPIFNENIIEIANYSKQWGGTFIPGKIEIIAEVYRNHPILPLVYSFSEAFEFQPEITIDETFEKEVNDSFQAQHSPDSVLYRFNYINDLFQALPNFETDGIDLKFKCIYKHTPYIVDLNDVETIKNNIEFEIAHFELPTYCRYEHFAIVLKWKAHLVDNLYMNVEDTLWGSPAKTILKHVRIPKSNIKMWYDPKIENWRLSY